ncbi:MAG: hypothetical protein ABSA85_08660 [Terracidiphilus sp.]|jgi:hypothetical protein
MTRPATPSHLRRRGVPETLVFALALSVLALLAVPAILGGKKLFAQTPSPQSTKPAQRRNATVKPAQARRRIAAGVHAAAAQGQPAPGSIADSPPASPAPIWPANQPPNQARVSWDSRGLEIDASNSSLNQILHQVAAETGAKFEGLTRDQRIFGSYGPGPGRDVLLNLLEGSGYNVLMIGGRDADPPLEIVLSIKLPAGAQTAANRNTPEDEPDPRPAEPLEPPSPPTVQQQFAQGNNVKTADPQQFMQDILQHQQRIDQHLQDEQNHPQQ